MDNKSIKLVKSALDVYYADDIKKWSKVVEYVDNWDEVRNYINGSVLPYSRTDALNNFQRACTKYNRAIENPQLSKKQKAGLLVGSAALGFFLGYRK